MHRFTTVDLGSYKGGNYVLVGFVEPPPTATDYDPDSDADSYGVTLARKPRLPTESNEEVVRLDSAHGRPHLDREYLPVNAAEPSKVWLDESWNYTKMESYLLKYWQGFVDEDLRYNGPP